MAIPFDRGYYERLDELETYVNGRPLEAVRRISDGTKQLLGLTGKQLNSSAAVMAKSISGAG